PQRAGRAFGSGHGRSDDIGERTGGEPKRLLQTSPLAGDVELRPSREHVVRAGHAGRILEGVGSMARGFESKDVEFQQAEAERPSAPHRVLTAEERDALARQRTIKLGVGPAKAIPTAA